MPAMATVQTDLHKYRFLWRWCRVFPGRVALLLAAILTGTVAELFCLSLLVPLMDFVLNPAKGGRGYGATYAGKVFDYFGIPYTLPTFLLFSFCVVAVTLTLVAARQVLSATLFFPVRQHIRDAAFGNVVTADICYAWDQRSGHLMNTLTGEIDKTGHAVDSFVQLLANVAIFVGYAVVLVAVSLPMIGVVLVVVALKWALAGPFIRRSQRLSHRMLDTANAQSASLLNMLQGIFLIKAFGTEETHKSEFQACTHAYAKVQTTEAVNDCLLRYLDNLLTPAVICLLTYLGIVVFQVDTGRLVVFLAGLKRLAPLITQINTNRNQVNANLAGIRQVEELLMTDNKPRLRSGTHAISELRDGLVLTGVSYRYPGAERLAVENVSLRVGAGERVALVGESGSGKTTLANLILRLMDPVSGVILVDGIDLRELRLTDWRALLGVVTQEPVLFHDSVANNIAYGLSRRPSQTEIEQAAVLAQAHEFIKSMSDGYQTIVGDRGAKLSGGQRQRLTIARAFLRDPRVILFDEATSALDTVTEHGIQEAVASLSQGRTVLTVAHRLSTIRGAHRIHVLEQGRVVGSGTHEQLLADCSRYRQLCAHQLSEA